MASFSALAHMCTECGQRFESEEAVYLHMLGMTEASSEDGPSQTFSKRKQQNTGKSNELVPQKKVKSFNNTNTIAKERKTPTTTNSQKLMINQGLLGLVRSWMYSKIVQSAPIKPEAKKANSQLKCRACGTIVKNASSLATHQATDINCPAYDIWKSHGSI